MGKGFIQENLGEGHYLVVLDIDVRYAREQLAAIQAYLAEFQPAYQEATERKDQAKAALGPINSRLHEYLARAQAESKAAYEVMIAAYEFWRDLIRSRGEVFPGSFASRRTLCRRRHIRSQHPDHGFKVKRLGEEVIYPRVACGLALFRQDAGCQSDNGQPG
jgi:hypothetical protein